MAGGRSRPAVHFPETDDGIMVVDGIRFDTIRALAPYHHTAPKSTEAVIIEGLCTLRDHPAQHYGNRKDQEDAFTLNLVAGRKMDGTQYANPISIFKQKSAVEDVSVGSAPAWIQEDGQGILTSAETFKTVSEDDIDIDVTLMWLNFYSFRFCITEQGFHGPGATGHGKWGHNCCGSWVQG